MERVEEEFLQQMSKADYAGFSVIFSQVRKCASRRVWTSVHICDESM